MVIKWATQINDVLTKESSHAFHNNQNPNPYVGEYIYTYYEFIISFERFDILTTSLALVDDIPTSALI